MLDDFIVIPIEVTVRLSDEWISDFVTTGYLVRLVGRLLGLRYLLSVLQPGQFCHDLVLCFLKAVAFKVRLGLCFAM